MFIIHAPIQVQLAWWECGLIFYGPFWWFWRATSMEGVTPNQTIFHGKTMGMLSAIIKHESCISLNFKYQLWSNNWWLLLLMKPVMKPSFGRDALPSVSWRIKIRSFLARNSWIRFNYTRQSFVSNHWKLMKGYPASGGYPAVPYTSNICIIQKLGSRDVVWDTPLRYFGLVQEILGTVDHPIHIIYISISTHSLKPNFDPRSQMSRAESPIQMAFF